MYSERLRFIKPQLLDFSSLTTFITIYDAFSRKLFFILSLSKLEIIDIFSFLKNATHSPSFPKVGQVFDSSLF
jgi:hypothetical protein